MDQEALQTTEVDIIFAVGDEVLQWMSSEWMEMPNPKTVCHEC